MSTLFFFLGVIFLLAAFGSFAGAVIALVVARRRAVPVATAPAPMTDVPMQPVVEVPSPAPSFAAAGDFDASTAATVYVPLPSSEPAYGSITWLSGPLAGTKNELTADGLVIGREAPADVVISAPSISKKHAWIGIRDGVPYVVDEGSTNGTFVAGREGERIVRHQLQPGDVIIVANEVARFRFDGPDAQ